MPLFVRLKFGTTVLHRAFIRALKIWGSGDMFIMCVLFCTVHNALLKYVLLCVRYGIAKVCIAVYTVGNRVTVFIALCTVGNALLKCVLIALC